MGKMPDSIGKKDPFYIFGYADDCLAYGDEQQCRELYERALDYYEKIQIIDLATKKAYNDRYFLWHSK